MFNFQLKPQISVIIATYNRAPILKKCLEHLYKQQGIDFEVIVVDDGSTDDTEQVVCEFPLSVIPTERSEEESPELPVSQSNNISSDEIPRLHWRFARNDKQGKDLSQLTYLKQPNSHQGAARNRGVKEAKGDIILFVDDDILVQPGFIKRHYDRHKEHPDENLVVLGFTTWDPELEINDYMWFLEASGWQFGYPFLNPGMIGKQQPYKFFYTSNLSLKKSFFLKEKFNESFKGYGFEDMELGYRLWKDHDMQIYYEPKASAYHHNLIHESELPKKMRSIGKAAVHFQKLHPEIWALPKGLKKWILKIASNPISLLLSRLFGKQFYFKLKSWREFWVGVRECGLE